MLIKEIINFGFKKLSGTPSPHLDSDILLSHVIKKPREFLYSHPEKKLTPTQVAKFRKLLSRRSKGEPVAYLTGHKEFYGLDFYVDKNVLVPRPETELLVDEAAEELRIRDQESGFKKTAVIDIGTGSGNIIISLAKKLKNCSIKYFAVDISQKALNVAKKNAIKHKISGRIKFLHGSLLKPFLNKKLEIGNWKLVILANLPYLSQKQYQQSPSIKFEPKTALVAAENGLALYKKLFQQTKDIACYVPNVTYFLEIDLSQTKSIRRLAKTILPNFNLQIKKDLAGRDRLVVLKNKN